MAHPDRPSLRFLVRGAFALALTAPLGCGSDGDDEGSGGSGATGGMATGGAAGSGTGGSSTTGGAAGSGTGGASGSGTGGAASGGTSGSGSGGAGGTGGAHAIKTVFVLVFENKAWCQIEGSSSAPYINGTLLTQGVRATQYKGPRNGGLHPSEPNYIWMEAGDTLGIVNDDDPDQNHQATTDHLVTQMKNSGVTWRSYQEDITGTECPLSSVGHYKPKHNPMVFFDDVTDTNDPASQYCIDHNRPLTQLETDLAAGTVAQYNFITPNQCSDMHDKCAPLNDDIKQGDDFLAEWIPKITASSAFADGGAIFVTWDEATLAVPCCITANCPIGMIVLSPVAKAGGYTNTIAYDHSSFLKTMQDVFSLSPYIRHAGDQGVQVMSDLFTSFP